MTIQQILESLLGQLGLLFALIFIIYGGFRGWWVWGWYAKELRDRIAHLEATLDRAARAAETGTASAERATRLAERTVEGSDGR